MEPGQVWLNLIPIFGSVWMFFTVIRVAETLDNEYYERRWHRRREDYGKMLGIISCALLLAGVTVPCLICGIMYWVKIAGYSRELVSCSPNRYDDEDDNEDDRRPRRRRRDRDDDDYEDDYDERRPRGRDRR